MLYGGAAGGGKSFFLRWWSVFYLMSLAEQGIKGATVGLFCEDYPSLLDRQISKIRVEFPPSLGTLKEGVTRDFELAPQYGGGRVLLRNLDDPSKYLSAEFAGIAVDELTRNGKDVFDFLRSRLRWSATATSPGVTRPRFVAGTNPSGIGHSWVKQLWIEGNFPPELRKLKPEFAFVPAKSSDNPYLSDSYHDDLETLPPDMAKAYAEGSWDIFAGQYFDIFKESEHCDRPEEWNLEPWWPRWISIDWGFKHNAAAYWFASEQDSVFTYREVVRNGLSPYLLAELICEANGKDKPKQIFLSPDAFAKRTAENTIAEQMGEVFRDHGLPNPTPADDDRVGGWMLCYQMLEAGYLRIGKNCKELIRALPTLIRDPIKIEDVEKMDGDDSPDAWRYGVKSMLAPRGKPLDVRIKDRISGFAHERGREATDLDPQTVAMLSRKAEMLERAKHKQAVPRWRPGMRRA